MTIQACAEIVAKGDPDRFAAAMSCPVQVRAVLFPIYAFNVEVARAPWASPEPMIAQMRLQWWADVLDEIAEGGPVRRHEVASVLSDVLDATGARLLQPLVEARRLDTENRPFPDHASLETYLQDTGGALLWVSARALGSDQEDRARSVGQGSALANYLLAAPNLIARGRQPLPDPDPAALRPLIAGSIAKLNHLKIRPKPVQRQAERAAWRARHLLKRAKSDPNRILDGTLPESEFRKRASLLLQSLI